MVHIGELCIEQPLAPMLIVIQTGTSCKWTHDSQRFLLEYFDLISNSPSHIYHSALPLSPSSSWLHKCYATYLSQEVKVVKGLPAEWGTCSHTVTLDAAPLALVCWKDTIALGLESNYIIVLNAITGGQVAVLSGHSSWVTSVTVSVDGTFLVSGSDDATAKLWDIQTGGVIKTYDHSGGVYSVSISPDSTTLASGCWDGPIHLWGVWTGVCFHVIHGHNNRVNSVSFSPVNSQHLISASRDHSVKQWDINGSQIGLTHEGDGVTFSLDGTHFVSWRNQVATIHNSESGVVVTELQVPSGKILCCCFSPNGEQMAAGAGYTIYIWDTICSDPHLFKTLVGHIGDIRALAFSSFIISVSEDRSVKFWQIGTSSADPVTTATIPTPATSAPIRSVSLQAKKGIAISTDLDGVVKTWDILTGLCKASFQTPAEGWARDAQLIDGRLIFVWYAEGKIHIWNTEKDELLQTVDTPTLHGLRISGDGSKVFGETQESIQSWSMQTGKAVGEVKLKGSNWRLDPLCADGSRIWACYKDSNEGWDFGLPGSSPTPLSNIFPNRPHLNFIHGTNWWDGGPSRIKDAVTGKDVFQLVGRYAKPHDVRWDGWYLVASYSSEEVLILDFNRVVPQ